MHAENNRTEGDSRGPQHGPCFFLSPIIAAVFVSLNPLKFIVFVKSLINNKFSVLIVSGYNRGVTDRRFGRIAVNGYLTVTIRAECDSQIVTFEIFRSISH